MSPRRREWLKRLLVVPPVALGIALLVWQIGRDNPPEQRTPPEVSQAVRVVEVAPVAFVPRATGYGTVAPGRVWEAVAQVSGKIVDQHQALRRGRLIEAGAEILRIDPTDYELAVARAQADLDRVRAQLDELAMRGENLDKSIEIERRALELAREDLARKQLLLERGNVPQSTVDEAQTVVLTQSQRLQELQNQSTLLPAERAVLEAQVALAETTVASARLDLERTSIRLPFDARIAAVNVEPTQFVNLGQVLVVADGIEVAEVDAQFPISRLAPLVRADIDLTTLSAAELGDVPRRLGLNATVRLRSEEVRASWDARFDRLSDRIDPQTRTVGVIVVVEEPYRKAIPGRRPPLAKDMFVEVELTGQPWPDVFVVPRVAVHRREGRPLLYVVGDDDRLVLREVELGPSQGDLAVVASGLAPGDRVVVSDLIPAILGMKLEPQLDRALAERLLAAASGEDERRTAGE